APTICPMTVAIAAPRIPIAGQPSRPKIIACYKRKRRENAGKNLFDFLKIRKYNNCHEKVCSLSA
ncbi:MAG: hypothetical protein ACLUQE_13635, partial [Dorea formicigenerans]